MSGTMSCVSYCTQAAGASSPVPRDRGGTQAGEQVGAVEWWSGELLALVSPGRSPHPLQGYALCNGAPLLSKGFPPCRPQLRLAGGLWDPPVG